MDVLLKEFNLKLEDLITLLYSRNIKAEHSKMNGGS